MIIVRAGSEAALWGPDSKPILELPAPRDLAPAALPQPCDVKTLEMQLKNQGVKADTLIIVKNPDGACTDSELATIVASLRLNALISWDQDRMSELAPGGKRVSLDGFGKNRLVLSKLCPNTSFKKWILQSEELLEF